MANPETQRDLKAGYVFADLLEQGVFDEEFEFFGLAFWEEEKVQFQITDNQLEIYNTFEQKTSSETITTPVLTILRRLRISRSERQQTILSLQNELKQNLTSIFPLSYFNTLIDFSRTPNYSTAYPVLLQYLETIEKNLTVEKLQAVKGLVNMALTAKTIDEAQNEVLLNIMDQLTPSSDFKANKKPTFSGFAYLDGEQQWKYYVNGHKPLTISKKIELTDQKVMTTPILEYVSQVENDKLSKLELRKNFLALVKETLDNNYLRVLQQLYSLQGSVNKDKFLAELKGLTQDINPIALKSIQRYGFLWHVY